MSQQVTFFREAQMEVVVHQVTCKCGEELDFSAEVDADQDLLIQVALHICEQETT